MHPFESRTLTDREFLTGSAGGRPALIAGELRIPTPGTDRLPAVVLVHGSSGVAGYVDDWVRVLNGLRVATFVFDAFTGRGFASVTEDQARLGRLNMIVDAYRALDLLARHPRVDPGRVAVMGFSRGGQAALYASMKRFQRIHAPGDARFAAYIAFYPDCMTRYREELDVADEPIRIFHGTADDLDPLAPCRAYVERLRQAGKDVQLTEYAGAQHLFDWEMLETPQRWPRAQTTRRCRLQEADDGRIVNAETRETFTYDDPCVERGVTVAYDAQAHRDAKKQVTEVVRDVLRPD